MPIGAMPQNQLDALPLITAVQAAAPDEVLIVGGTVTKFWNPVTIGIVNQRPFLDGSGGGAAMQIHGTNFLDFSGMNHFLFMLLRFNGDAPAQESITARIKLVPRVQLPGGASGAGPYIEDDNFVNDGPSIPLLATTWNLGTGPNIGAVKLYQFGWDNNETNFLGDAPILFGRDQRIHITLAGSTLPNNANQLFTLYIWAQS